MSFSGDIKEELVKYVTEARHCAIAELAAIVSLCGINENEICIFSENKLLLKRCLELIKIIFKDNIHVSIYKEYYIKTGSQKEAVKLFETLKIKSKTLENHNDNIMLYEADNIVIQYTCCKRSFIRGAFLASGSVSSPEKAYHYEIVFQLNESAGQLIKVLKNFNIEAKVVKRGRYYVAYIKEGSQIADALNVMGAHTALMEFENVRIVKEMRNTVNRQVNCETANLNKTVIAATKQVEDIIYIDNKIGLDSLSEGLEEIARLRIAYPDAALIELGSMLSTPIGKSGVNHRLKKLSSIAEGLREGKAK